MSSNSTLNNSVLSTARVSIDEGDNLNDDLAVESEVSSFVSQPGPNSNPNTHRRSESAISFRNSIDVESSFSSVLQFNPDESFNVNDELSPLGPNSIYALTVGSDNARAKRNRAPKSSVTINGGLTTINNLKYPTYKDIPQIQLHKLKHKIKNEQITSKYVKNSLQEYKSFESSYNNLTEDSLQQFSQKKGFKDDDQLSTSSSIDQFQYKESDDINAIPSVFLDQNFRLDDPRIFKQVMEDSTILYDNELVNNNALQEKFSHYLDIVEVNLIKEISKTSDSFFSTIGDIQIMKEESDECVEQFKLIKSKLDKLGEEHAHLGNKILEKLAEQRNVEYLESSIIQLKYIISIFELANKSYNNAKYNKCLTEIVVVENLIRGVSYDQLTDEEVGSFYPKFDYPLVNLSNLPALVYLQNDLQNLKEECSKGYINDFIQILLGDLRDHYNSVSTGDTLNRIYNSIDKQKKYQSRTVNTSYSTVKDEKKTKLIDYVKNLGKAGKLTQAYSLYQEKIITEIKDIIKNNLPNASNQNGNYLSVDLSNAPSRSSSDPPESANSSQAQPVSNTLSSNIKSLTPREFETMFIKIYCNLSECLRRLTAHQKLLLDIALTNVSPDVTRNIDIMALDISMAINRAIELTQIRLTKVINVRSEQTADIPVPYYLRLYSISSAYLQECELISPGYVAPGGGNSLSDWFKHHILYFVHRFHSNSLKKLISDCDRETWKEIVQSDILEKYQSILDEITGYATFLSSAGAEGFSGSKWMDLFDFYDYGKIESPHKGSVSGDRTRLATGKESFMIPNLTLVALEAIRDYLIISKAFPNTTSIIETNILNYFKLMNSKTSQAVLNAGATRTAGLKHITTKHLALCIQVVEFNIALLPNVQLVFAKKETSPVQRDPNQSDELTFYRIISNYKDHENEIFSKLVSIMHDRTLSHCNAIIGIDWSQPLTHPRQCHQYMETLVKDTTTVAKVLSRYLAEIKCSLILSQIFDNYKRLLVECYCTKLKQFKDFNEKQMVLKDIDFFRVKLCELPGYGNSGQVIWENVNSLPTEEDTKMAEIMRKNIEGEIKSNVESAGNSKKNSLDI
ncbi:Vps54-like protein-domain-containing protein, partial [Scheffersomyces coipomensis]|uniref:Vps54-like protein-domain-containing protein n=1 Tax=Scheffersomyces coipomensis TaxID=1788519 RepID=UPI00315CFC1B